MPVVSIRVKPSSRKLIKSTWSQKLTKFSTPTTTAKTYIYLFFLVFVRLFLNRKKNMAEEHRQKSSHESEPTVGGEGSVEAKDRGLFDFMGKKEEEKPQKQEVIAAEFDQKVQVSEQHEPPKVEETKIEETKVEEEKKPGLLEKLHRSGSSSSSSSSDEEEGEGEKKKKKRKEKKGLKEKISGEKEEEKHEEDASIPVEVVHQEPAQSEEKKGFLDKIKEKLPGQHKKAEEAHPPTSPPPPPPPPPAEHHEAAPPSLEGEQKEKKGIFEKIKEKIPGYHSKTTEDEKEKEREKGTASD